MQLIWHRADLRLHDNEALVQAAKAGPVVGVVIFDPHILQATTVRRVAWFMHNVQALRERYQACGGQLLVRTGKPWEVLPQLCQQLSAVAVHATANFTPYALERDALVRKALAQPLHTYAGQYIHSPDVVLKPDGKPYTVFTPYYKKWQQHTINHYDIPQFTPAQLPETLDIGSINPPESDVPLPAAGEIAALQALEHFIQHKLDSYPQERNALHGQGGSGLSHYFSIGVLSPRGAVHSALKQLGEQVTHGVTSRSAHPSGSEQVTHKVANHPWIAELAWRDFSGALLYHFPHMLHSAIDPKWNAFTGQPNPELLQAWQQGQTGIPLVDACMNQLRLTGFLSNRGRMCVAQFAVKLAQLPWQECEQTMKHWLLDGDTASNLQGWQWAGGLGVDAAPYFRVFSMESQAKTHDPDGSYISQWSGYTLAPTPVINLQQAREQYLQQAQAIVKSG